MGSMSFLLPEVLPESAAATLPEAALASSRGYDDMTPVPTRVQVAGGRLTLSRTHNESGYLVVPWPVPPFGTLAVSSSTLRERRSRTGSCWSWPAAS